MLVPIATAEPHHRTRTARHDLRATVAPALRQRTPELIANALRDWCRFSRIGISYIEPDSPWENPYIES
jgi:hypothetical protein